MKCIEEVNPYTRMGQVIFAQTRRQMYPEPYHTIWDSINVVVWNRVMVPVGDSVRRQMTIAPMWGVREGR